MGPVAYNVRALDGFAFEDAVGEVFRRLGYSVTPGGRVRDGGRDLVVRRGDDVIVIECKNHGKPIGRPVIQKLHSAALTFGSGAKGMVVSASGFSVDAIEYARSILPHQAPVALWDFVKLFEAGRGVGVMFTSGSSSVLAIHGPPKIADERAGFWLWESHLASLASAPRTARSAIRVYRKTHRTPVAAVVVGFQLDRTFTNSSGNRVVHAARAGGRVVQPLNGAVLEPVEADLVMNAAHVPIPADRVESEHLQALFGPGFQEAVGVVRSQVAEGASTRVWYRGRNGRTYVRQASVAARDVSANGLPVVFERIGVVVGCGPLRHEMTVVGDGQHLWLVCAKSDVTDVRAIIGRKGLICNDCGRISSINRARGGCCTRCRRTICREHSHWRPVHPVLRRARVCGLCVAAEANAPQPSASRWNVLVGLVPGIYWVFVNRPRCAMASGASLVGLALIGLALTGFQLFWGGFALALVSVLSLVEAAADAALQRRYARVMESQRNYRPEWS